MKKIILLLCLFPFAFFAKSQTNATDFNVNDCNGNPHHLFDELDAGKIIVISMVDPCGSCIGPSISANNVVKSYATSNPGKVLFYITDDFGNTSCTSLLNWCSNNGLSGIVTISNTAVTQANYGGAAMPKVIVLGGKDHKVYFNQNNGLNTTNLTNAINTAIGATGLNTEKTYDLHLTVYPNPATEQLTLNYVISQSNEVSIDIFNMLGAKVLSVPAEKKGLGKMETSIDLQDLQNGLYFVKISAGKSSEIIKFTITR